MMKQMGGAIALLVAACIVAAPRAEAAIAPYVSDSDTAVLYHLDEAAVTKSADTADYVISDVDGNVTLRTDVGVSPFDETDGPGGLGTAMTSWTIWKRAFRESGTDTSLFSTTQFTIEAWVRDPGTLGGDLGTDLNTIFRVAGAGDIQFAVETIADEKKLRLKYNLPAGTSTLYSDAVTFDSEAWYHAAVTYDDHGAATPDDSTVTFYFTPESSFNLGAQEAGQHANAEDLEAFATAGLLSIGETFRVDNFNGYIDELRYSNVVRNFSGAIPESGSLVALGIALLAMRRRRS